MSHAPMANGDVLHRGLRCLKEASVLYLFLYRLLNRKIVHIATFSGRWPSPLLIAGATNFPARCDAIQAATVASIVTT